MRLLPKQLSKEEFDYVSERSVEGLKSDIQQLFDKTRGWNFSINLTGGFTSDNEFSVRPKWQTAYIRGGGKETAYINGRIFGDELKRTRVKFTLKSNSIYTFFFFLFPLFGLFILASSDINRNKSVVEIIVLLISFTIGVPVLMLIFAHAAKQGLKDRFIKTFNLKPVDYQISGLGRKQIRNGE